MFLQIGKTLISRGTRPLISCFQFYSATNKTIQNSTIKEKSNLPEQSILEQILIKHEQKPQTTGEKCKHSFFKLIDKI